MHTRAAGPADVASRRSSAAAASALGAAGLLPAGAAAELVEWRHGLEVLERHLGLPGSARSSAATNGVGAYGGALSGGGGSAVRSSFSAGGDGSTFSSVGGGEDGGAVGVGSRRGSAVAGGEGGGAVALGGGWEEGGVSGRRSATGSSLVGAGAGSTGAGVRSSRAASAARRASGSSLVEAVASHLGGGSIGGTSELARSGRSSTVASSGGGGGASPGSDITLRSLPLSRSEGGVESEGGGFVLAASPRSVGGASAASAGRASQSASKLSLLSSSVGGGRSEGGASRAGSALSLSASVVGEARRLLALQESVASEGSRRSTARPSEGGTARWSAAEEGGVDEALSERRGSSGERRRVVRVSRRSRRGERHTEVHAKRNACAGEEDYVRAAASLRGTVGGNHSPVRAPPPRAVHSTAGTLERGFALEEAAADDAWERRATAPARVANAHSAGSGVAGVVVPILYAEEEAGVWAAPGGVPAGRAPTAAATVVLSRHGSVVDGKLAQPPPWAGGLELRF